MKKLLLLFIALTAINCTKEEMECETYYQVTIEISETEKYTTFVFENDAIFNNVYGDVVTLDGRNGKIIERIPFNTCPEQQPYL